MAAADYIPEEILMEILLKLPAGKWLIRAMSVCKAWKSLIRSPSFISLHLANAENQALVPGHQHFTLFPKKANNNWPLIDHELPKSSMNNCYYSIVGSCNGLLCLRNELVVPSVIIWNPCIRNHVILPESHLINRNEALCVVLGFGVATNVYKVVRLVFYNKDWYSLIASPPQAEIFTLGSATGTTWRKLLTRTGIDVGVVPNSAYSWFFKGFVHWIVYHFKEDGDRDVSGNLILTFHVGDEVFGEIVLPQELKRGNVATLAIIGREESFGAIDYIWETDNVVKCNVWMMKDYDVKESWTKLYTIICDGFQRLIGILENSDEVLVQGVDDGLITYNAKTKGIKHVGVFESRCSRYVGDFKESLVLLGGSGETCQDGLVVFS